MISPPFDNKPTCRDFITHSQDNTCPRQFADKDPADAHWLENRTIRPPTPVFVGRWATLQEWNEAGLNQMLETTTLVPAVLHSDFRLGFEFVLQEELRHLRVELAVNLFVFSQRRELQNIVRFAVGEMDRRAVVERFVLPMEKRGVIRPA